MVNNLQSVHKFNFILFEINSLYSLYSFFHFIEGVNNYTVSSSRHNSCLGGVGGGVQIGDS